MNGKLALIPKNQAGTGLGQKDFGTPASPKCLADKQEGMKAPRTHEGLPVMEAAEFDRYVAMAPPENGVRTFNYQGYLEFPQTERLFYAEAFAANLRNGIRVWANGELASSGLPGGLIAGLGSPDHVGYYSVSVKVPSGLQQEMGAVCAGGDCMSESEFRRGSGSSVEEARGREEDVVFMVPIDPREDAEGREKVRFLVMAIARYLEGGMPLARLREFASDATELLRDTLPSGDPAALFK